MIRIFAAAAIVLAGAVVGTSAGAASYSATYLFRDSAPGHHRSQSVKMADIRACGADRHDVVANSRLHALLNCMRAQGWAVSGIERAAAGWTSNSRPAIEAQSQDEADTSATDAADEAATTDEENAEEQSQQQSDDDTQAWVNDQENAAMAEVGADTMAQGQAEQEAADLAEAEAPMAQQ